MPPGGQGAEVDVVAECRPVPVPFFIPLHPFFSLDLASVRAVLIYGGFNVTLESTKRFSSSKVAVSTGKPCSFTTTTRPSFSKAMP